MGTSLSSVTHGCRPRFPLRAKGPVLRHDHHVPPPHHLLAHVWSARSHFRLHHHRHPSRLLSRSHCLHDGKPFLLPSFSSPWGAAVFWSGENRHSWRVVPSPLDTPSGRASAPPVIRPGAVKPFIPPVPPPIVTRMCYRPTPSTRTNVSPVIRNIADGLSTCGATPASAGVAMTPRSATVRSGAIISRFSRPADR